jgi:hypothetical protein
LASSIARQQEQHPRHAAYLAREVSTDFAMRGDWAPIGYAYGTIIFLKATVNGIDRLYRGVTKDPNRLAIAGRVAVLAMLSTGLYALNRGNPLYAIWRTGTRTLIGISSFPPLRRSARGSMAETFRRSKSGTCTSAIRRSGKSEPSHP